MSDTSSSSLFNGTSRYSTDLQSVLNRAISIASLPLYQMESQATALSKQQTELALLDSKLTALQSSVTNLNTALGSSSYSGTSSNEDVVTVSTGEGVLAGTYAIEVTSLGSYNNTMSKDGLTKVTSASSGNITTGSHFTLTAGGETYSFTASNLKDMVSKINDSGLDVQASLVNVGSSSSPDYRISVQGSKLGALGISLTDDDNASAELLNTQAAGELASYKVNGYSTPATSDSRTVEIAPGLTLTLVDESETGVETTVTVSRNAASVKNALSSFVTAYNAAAAEVDNNRGEGTGALVGQSIVYTIGRTLSSIHSYSPDSGPFASLEDLGLSVDKDGQLSFDPTIFDDAFEGKLSDVMSFLGGTSSGGFLKSVNDALNELEDEDTGIITSAKDSVADQISAQEDRIAKEEDRIGTLQSTLETRLAAADAAIAALEQQANYISSLLQSMETAKESFNS